MDSRWLQSFSISKKVLPSTRKVALADGASNFNIAEGSSPRDTYRQLLDWAETTMDSTDPAPVQTGGKEFLPPHAEVCPISHVLTEELPDGIGDID